MRTLCPEVTREQPPALSDKLNGRLDFLGQHKRKPVIPRRNKRIPPQVEKNHVVPTFSQDEALARDGVSREVPCSALKGETVPDSLHATPKSPPTRRVRSRGTPRVPAPLPLSPFSPSDRDRSVDCPAWSGRGSRPSRRTSGGGQSHEEIRDEPRGWGHMPNAPDSPVRP